VAEFLNSSPELPFCFNYPLKDLATRLSNKMHYGSLKEDNPF